MDEQRPLTEQAGDVVDLVAEVAPRVVRDDDRESLIGQVGAECANR